MLFSLFSNIGSKEGLIITLTTLLLRIPAILLALSIHEASHAFVADKLGDPTARNLGRITINPIKHLDPIGAISMLIFGIGWAKPVPVNSRYFKKPKRDMALTAAAGPLSNIVQALIALPLLFLFTKLLLSSAGLSEISSAFVSYESIWNLLFSMILYESFGFKIAAILIYFLLICATLNIILAFFNLIPIPPFDGSRIAFVFLPDKFYFGVMKYERIIMLVFLVLFFVGGRFGLFDSVFTWIINLFFKTFSWIMYL